MESSLEIAAALCRKFEGFFPHPYLCPAGVPTIGYGATHYEDGRAVKLSDQPISRERAEEILRRELAMVCLPAVRKLCGGIDTAAQLAAVGDWSFNLGTGRLKTSTMRKRIIAGDWTGAAVECRKWVFGGGRKLPGLARRRDAEAALMV